MKKENKETINLVSLIAGIMLIIIGLTGSAIIIPLRNQIIIVPIFFLILGAFLALMGGLRKWD